jgi:hypothetical protein
VLDHLHNLNHDLSVRVQQLVNESDAHAVSQTREQVLEATGIIEKISKLKYEMGRDKALEYVPYPPGHVTTLNLCLRNIEDDGEPFVELYNAELAKLAKKEKNTWFTAPWLFAEYVAALPLFIPYLLELVIYRCYLYGV